MNTTTPIYSPPRGAATTTGRRAAGQEHAVDVPLAAHGPEEAVRRQAVTRPDERAMADVTGRSGVQPRPVTRAAGAEGFGSAARSTRRYAEFLVDGL
jgi:hypothetical protein